MNPSRTIGELLRDHLFVLAWIAIAVLAKYSISATSSSPAPPQHESNPAIAAAK